ncbi:MAG: HAMP domain-containing histidine kinase [Bacteroidetes bacterium]|nr:HAMP domain-containing histidine kinase [Bacteroidota bacterium]
MPSARNISGNVPAIFAGVMLVFIIALAWLGWILIEQDSDLVTQRKRDAIEASVSEASATLTSQIADERRQLRQLLADWPPDPDLLESTAQQEFLAGRVALVISQDGISAYPDSALRYYPTENIEQADDPRLTDADRLEFGQNALSRASSILEVLSTHTNPDTRAGALARLARIRRKQNQHEDALSLYQQLIMVTDASVAGVPAILLGLYGRCSILESRQSYDLLGEEAVRLGESLLNGGNQISKSRYQFYAQSVIDWIRGAATESVDPWIEMLNKPHVPSEAARMLYEIWNGWTSNRELSEGFRSVRVDSALVVLHWLGSEDQFAGMIGDTSFVRDHWLTSLGAEYEATGIGLSITDDSGNKLFSIGVPSGNIQATRTLASAGQTWTITSYVTDSFEVEPQNRTRRQILLGSLFLVIVIVASSTYFLSRALRRELTVAQLQSDFVSAVSHEFRTPLTSMRQITEMLSSGRVPSQERLQAYYSDLDKESRRLSRLVEGLLNFGRMEAGGFPYIFESLAIGDLVSETVAEFKNETSLGDDDLRLLIDANPKCNLDRDTFKLALWNLLDNARKYSGDLAEIFVQVSARDSQIHVAVSDKGPGISVSDQARIFDKFVRGPDTARTGVKGTGLGLALVKKIVDEHGGKIILESERNVGSTFTLILPIRDES